MNALFPNSSRCGRAVFCPATPVGTVSDSAAFYQNNVEAGHVAERSVRRLLFAFPSRLKRSSPSRSLAFAGSGVLHETWRCGFSVAHPDRGLAAGHVGPCEVTGCTAPPERSLRFLQGARRPWRLWLLFSPSRLKRSSPRRSPAFWGAPVSTTTWHACFSVALLNRGLEAGHVAQRSDRLNDFSRPDCTLGS